MGTWRVMIADTVTGNVLADVTPRDLPSFSRKLTDKGSWTINVIPDDRANQHLDFHAYTDAGKNTWIIFCDDFIVQAGPIFTYSFDENTRNLSVSGTGIQGLFDRRELRNDAGDPAKITTVANDVKLTNFSLRGLAREIVAAALHPAGYGLPIDIPATETGTHNRTYQGYDLAMAWDRLAELSKVVNGPELDFQPYLVPAGNKIRWELLIGGPKLGNQTSLAVWDYGGALSRIDVDVNGSATPCTRVWAKGAGDKRAMVVGYANDSALIALGYPPADFVDADHTSSKKKTTLDDYAAADLAKFKAPTESWKCAVHIDGITTRGVEVSPRLGTWALGDAPKFGISEHPWIPDGQYRRRILGYSSATESTVDLELQDTLEVL